jgi:hypothetical protein
MLKVGLRDGSAYIAIDAGSTDDDRPARRGVAKPCPA